VKSLLTCCTTLLAKMFITALSQGGIVPNSVRLCVFVWMSVNTIIPEPFEISIIRKGNAVCGCTVRKRL